MKASFLRKLWIITVTIAYTLWTSLIVFYLRLTRSYNRQYADSVLRWWSAGLLRPVNATWEVHNPHNVTIKPGRPHIIMVNHRSHYDIPLSFVSLPGSIRMLTKKELFKIPVFGTAMKAAEFISIDRKNIEQALKDLDEARVLMQSGIVLWVAPEGSRSRTGKLGEFKKGGFMLALQTGAIIIPVGIKGSETILAPGSLNFFLGRKVEINIGEPVDAALYNSGQRDALMQDVNHAIQALISEKK